MFFHHEFHLAERLFPKAFEADNRKTVVKPTVHFPGEHLAALPAPEQKFGHRFRPFRTNFFYLKEIIYFYGSFSHCELSHWSQPCRF